MLTKSVLISCLAFIILLSFDTGTNNVIRLNDYIDNDYIEDWVYVYKLARVRNRHKLAVLYSDNIIKYSEKYDLNPRFIARQTLKESGMVNWKKSYKIDIVTNNELIETNRRVFAMGASQITIHWSHLLYYIDDGKLGKHLKNKEIKGIRFDVSRYYYKIPYSIEMQCYIMSNLMDRYDNHLPTALISYWAGGNSREFRYYSKGKRYTKNHYVVDIITDKLVNRTFRIYGKERKYVNDGYYYIRKRTWNELYNKFIDNKI